MVAGIKGIEPVRLVAEDARDIARAAQLKHEGDHPGPQYEAFQNAPRQVVIAAGQSRAQPEQVPEVGGRSLPEHETRIVDGARPLTGEQHRVHFLLPCKRHQAVAKPLVGEDAAEVEQDRPDLHFLITRLHSGSRVPR